VIRVIKKGKYMNKKKLMPQFKNEANERAFWQSHDFSDYVDQFEAVEMDLSELKPSTESISLRLPVSLLSRLKEIANSQDVPYQSLMKVFLADKVKSEFAKSY